MPTVESLIQQSRQGSREAFAALYDRFARALFLDLVGRVGSREDAEDALQAVFLKAWTRLGSLRDDARFTPWLFRLARNRAIDVLRRRRRRPQEALPDDTFAPVDDAFPGDTEVLERLVADLKPESRALLMLRAVQGWSAEDIGTAWGQSASTIRRRYTRIVEHLDANLAREERHV